MDPRDEQQERPEEMPGFLEDIETKTDDAAQSPAKKRWFGRGIYGSKDVPIRLLDGLIAGLLVAIISLTVIFAVTGGFMVTFNSQGGSEIPQQKVRHSGLVKEPEAPEKPGYVFDGWYYEGGSWNFESDKVGGDLDLSAGWTPAQITIKFDLDGGTVKGSQELKSITAAYQEPYGELPIPEKEGAEFAGWVYSGTVITAETPVTMTGEHVLTASWE